MSLYEIRREERLLDKLEIQSLYFSTIVSSLAHQVGVSIFKLALRGIVMQKSLSTTPLELDCGHHVVQEGSHSPATVRHHPWWEEVGRSTNDDGSSDINVTREAKTALLFLSIELE